MNNIKNNMLDIDNNRVSIDGVKCPTCNSQAFIFMDVYAHPHDMFSIQGCEHISGISRCSTEEDAEKELSTLIKNLIANPPMRSIVIQALKERIKWGNEISDWQEDYTPEKDPDFDDMTDQEIFNAFNNQFCGPVG